MKNKKRNTTEEYSDSEKEPEVDLKKILERKKNQNSVLKKIIKQINNPIKNDR